MSEGAKSGVGRNWSWPPIGTPPNLQRSSSDNAASDDPHWRHFDNSVSDVSFGFVATAILISMFLVMAIFERFIRPPSPEFSTADRRRQLSDVESQMGFHGKLNYPSPKVSAYAREVSVLMPGQDIPTFIAQPAPAPCPRERIQWPLHQFNPSLDPARI